MPLIDHPGRPVSDLAGIAIPARRGVCVALPAKDEEERIGACLNSLLQQKTKTRFSIFVLANNCRDATADVVRAIAEQAPVDIHLCETHLEPSPTPAARARRLSVNAGMEIAGSGGAVLTSDADSIVDENWVQANLDEIAAGADLVLGAVAPMLAESATFPEHVMHRAVWEFALEQAQAEMESLLDPLPWDPWPLHRMVSGASLAGRVSAILGVGGVPLVEPGEDRALMEIIQRAGGRVRHSNNARIFTSCRLDGRARGGWADDLRERVQNPQALCHQSLEPSQTLFRRATLRGAMRAVWPHVDIPLWSRRLRIAPLTLRKCIEVEEFEAAWHRIETESPYLVRKRIRVEELPTEARRGRRLLEFVRGRVEVDPAAANHKVASFV